MHFLVTRCENFAQKVGCIIPYLPLFGKVFLCVSVATFFGQKPDET